MGCEGFRVCITHLSCAVMLHGEQDLSFVGKGGVLGAVLGLQGRQLGQIHEQELGVRVKAKFHGLWGG